MTSDDYQRLGFMCGLEVHQQLLTRGKLFCRCPAGRSVDHYDAEVLRHMRPTLSELGEYDGTALMEFKTRKEILYRLERGTVCTYEMDDAPPFEIDRDAVRIAVRIAHLLDLNLVSELHVMRKQYLDGSIPTGFQRTAMIGLAGAIPFRVPEIGADRELRIRQLSLEEDSCREVSDIGHRVTFRTDRLGTPLTETVTEPELLTPVEVQAAGRLIARIAQATGEVRRGPGAARQDVNVSVAGGRRIEIKGVDHHRRLPLLVHVEAFRQLNLLRIREELRRRGVGPGMLAVPQEGPVEESSLVADVGGVLRGTDYAPIRGALDRAESVYAVRLPGFAGIFTRPTQPGVTFASEFADRLRVIACLEARPFMIHFDMRDYALGPSRWHAVRKRMRADREDALLLLWGPRRDAETAVREVFLRAREALDGVPAETRQAFPDGTNGFERILPGPDRMYPDTDTPPVALGDELVAEVASGLPETPWRREERYRELGLDGPTARRLASSSWGDLFDRLQPPGGEVARRLAHALEKRLPFHRRSRGYDPTPGIDRLRALVRAVSSGELRGSALERGLDALVESPSLPAERVLDRFRPRPGDPEAVERAVASACARARRELPGREEDVLVRWAMGQVVPRFEGRCDPRDVRRRLTDGIRSAPSKVTS